MLWVLEFVETDLEDQHLQIKIFYIYKLPSCFHSGCLPSSCFWISVSVSSSEKQRRECGGCVVFPCSPTLPAPWVLLCDATSLEAAEAMPVPWVRLVLLRPLSWSRSQAARVVSCSSCPAEALPAVGGHSAIGRKLNSTRSQAMHAETT